MRSKCFTPDRFNQAAIGTMREPGQLKEFERFAGTRLKAVLKPLPL